MQKRYLTFLFLIFLVACRSELPAPIALPITPTNTFTPPATDAPTATAVPPTASATATAVPTHTASATPTPAPLSVGSAPGLPAELTAVWQETVASLANVAWSDQAANQLAVNPTAPLFSWVYAVAAPFATIPDNLPLTAVEQAWQQGLLLLDAETEAVFRSWWGAPAQTSQIVAAADLVDLLWAQQTDYNQPRLTILPVHQLDIRLKVLRIDGRSPVDMDFDPADYPLTIPFGLVGPDAEALRPLWSGPTSNWDDGRVTHIVMTGPAGMRRAVAERMDRYGIQYPGEETGPILQAADIAHMSNENAFASDCPPADPYDSVNVCNRDEYFELMTWMGIDVAEMTGNHLNDWGTAALHHTFDMYEANGIGWFGGGRDLADAAQPLLIEHNGNQIAFVGCNPVGPEYGWASENRPGALPCGDYSQLHAQIGQLAADGYLVMVTLQYLEDYQYAVLSEQRQVFQALAAAGATAVSGSHAHHPQGFSFYNHAFIHYGLGNLLADQMWSLGSRQTFLDVYTVYDGRLLNVSLWTGLNEDYARVRQMTAVERQGLLQAVFDASDW